MMKILSCLRCGCDMGYFGQELIQLGKTSLILGDLPNLVAGALEVDIYSCPKCGKLEFFCAGSDEDETQVMEGCEVPPEINQDIVGVSRTGIPQVRCPVCGKKHDFDYPKCPRCKHKY